MHSRQLEVEFNSIKKKELDYVLVYDLVISVSVFFNLNLKDKYIDGYDMPGQFYLTASTFDEHTAKVLFYFVHFFFNDCLILLLNLVVDCCLVRLIKWDLVQKMLNKQNMNSINHTEMSPLEMKRMKEEEMKKAAVERKSNAMIVLSVVIYLFCRVPELVGILVFYFFEEIYMSCLANFICYSLSSFVEYLYMLSYIFNIFLYYNFNSYFRHGLRNYLGFKQK